MKRWKNKDHPEAVLEGKMVRGEGRDEDAVDGEHTEERVKQISVV